MTDTLVTEIIFSENTQIAEYDCGERTIRRLRSGQVSIVGGDTPVTGDAAQAKLGEYVLQSLLTDEQITELLSVFQPYEVGKAYKANDLFSYDNKLYKVVQAHTSQADWVPGVADSLYTAAVPDNVIPVWNKPEGAHDAYAKGAQVEWPGGSGTIWESTIDANVTEPGTLLPWGYWVKA